MIGRKGRILQASVSCVSFCNRQLFPVADRDTEVRLPQSSIVMVVSMSIIIFVIYRADFQFTY